MLLTSWPAAAAPSTARRPQSCCRVSPRVLRFAWILWTWTFELGCRTAQSFDSETPIPAAAPTLLLWPCGSGMRLLMHSAQGSDHIWSWSLHNRHCSWSSTFQKYCADGAPPDEAIYRAVVGAGGGGLRRAADAGQPVRLPYGHGRRGRELLARGAEKIPLSVVCVFPCCTAAAGGADLVESAC